MSFSGALAAAVRPRLRPLHAVFPLAGPSRLQGRSASSATATALQPDEDEDDLFEAPVHYSTPQRSYWSHSTLPQTTQTQASPSTPPAPLYTPAPPRPSRRQPLYPRSEAMSPAELPQSVRESVTVNPQPASRKGKEKARPDPVVPDPLKETAREQEVRLRKMLETNAGLDEEDARLELEWMRTHIREERTKAHRPVIGKGFTYTHNTEEQERLAARGVPTRREQLEDMVRRRATGEPLQYILGTAHFGPLELRVRAPVLIPREETAHVFSRFSYAKRPGMRVCDLCCGSGAVALLMAHFNPRMQVVGFDVNPQAIELARENAKMLKLDDRVVFVQLDLFARDAVVKLRSYAGSKVFPTKKRFMKARFGRGLGFDLVVSNPPYVTPAEYEELPPSVKLYEDRLALIGTPPKWYTDAHPPRVSRRTRGRRRVARSFELGPRMAHHHNHVDGSTRGLAFYSRIAEIAPHILRKTPTTLVRRRGKELKVERVEWRYKQPSRVALEIGVGQAKAVRNIVRRMPGISTVRSSTDQYGRSRLVVGRG